MLRSYLQLVRIHNVVLTFVAVAIGYLSIASIDRTVLASLAPLALAAVSAASIAAASYAVNDYFDYAIDAVNKPYRPIPSGRVSRARALAISLALYLAGIAAATVVGLATLFIAVLASLLSFYYSKSLKRSGLLGNAVVSLLSALTIAYGAMATVEWFALPIQKVVYALIPFAYAFTLSMAREVVKGIEDVKGDAAYGVKTVAVSKGIATARALATALALSVASLSLAPYLAGYLGLAYALPAAIVALLCGAAIAELWRARDLDSAIARAARARAVLKLAFAVGILAFIAGYLEKVAVVIG